MKTIAMKKTKVSENVASAEDLTEGAPGATGVRPPAGGGHAHLTPPDPEVQEQKPRRIFTAGYKLRLLQQAEMATTTRESALRHCEDLQVADYDDWRLPNINELQSLVDYSQNDPAIDTVSFFGAVSSQLLVIHQSCQLSGSRLECAF